MATYAVPKGIPRAFVQGAPAVPPPPAAPAGTFLPGTKVQVGSHRVVIDRYLSEGGFAHVYVVTLPKSVDGKDKAVLKRVAVPDKEHLANMRTEVDTMKRLKGRKHIVKYFDSHASPLTKGGYEVFLLMEWCNGGGLIDFMNTRLQNRLTEPEILTIFTDIAEGVACMHYLKPALLHRDLKVENVLITKDGSNTTYKLCDFGSAAVPRPAATTAAEGRLVEDDVLRHTTLQYRSPEMIDVYRKQPIDEKSDIWALGCFLYKLCYYTTPFEEVGQMAILNASFKYPGYPRFSDDLKLLIASMLREQPSQRPNIYQVLAKACKMDGRALPVRDIYTGRSRSEDARPRAAAPTTSVAPSKAVLSPPGQAQPPSMPQIEPMRRGRPLAPSSQHNSAKPSPSPLRMVDSSDPFAQLDVKNGRAGDELSTRFPKLEEFSLISDQRSKFTFDPPASNPPEAGEKDLSARVTEALADDAFARPENGLEKSSTEPAKPPELGHASTVRERTGVANAQEFHKSAEPPAPPSRKSNMVSTGTMTSPSPSTPAVKPFSDRPVWRVPVQEKGDTVERAATFSVAQGKGRPPLPKAKSGSRLAYLLKTDAAQSQPAPGPEPMSPSSSRPSLEGGRPLLRDLDSGVHRSRSLNLRHRPVSVNIGAGPTHIRDREIKRPKDVPVGDFTSEAPPLSRVDSETSETNIRSDLEFLKAREEEEKGKSHHMRRLSSGSRHQKRTSLPSMALSGTKNLLHGRFGDAFKKFEGSGDSEHRHGREHSPAHGEPALLSPIEGSEATDLSEDRRGLDETEDLSPELRRELEKQRLEAEERRVERAAAEYRQRVGTGAKGPPVSAKAASIQNRVHSLLKENDKPAQKTAAGYGRFTPDTLSPASEGVSTVRPPPVGNTLSTSARSSSLPSSSANLRAQMKAQRPTAPPKPKVLQRGRDETPSHFPGGTATAVNGNRPDHPDDWETQFAQKYPSLANLDMVEADIDGRRPSQPRMKEV